MNTYYYSATTVSLSYCLFLTFYLMKLEVVCQCICLEIHYISTLFMSRNALDEWVGV